MKTCPHGIALPSDPKFSAQDVCAYCRGIPSPIDSNEGYDGSYWDKSDFERISHERKVAINGESRRNKQEEDNYLEESTP